MSENTRDRAVFFRLPSTLWEAIEADMAERGQSITTWMQRACESRLAQRELPLTLRDGG